MNTMLYAALLGLVAANPCTNGSFEEVGPDGFAADWQIVGQTVALTDDAHGGQRAVRMLRTEDTEPRETGLNRDWRADDGQRGAMIDRLEGGIEFWYKAVSAHNAKLNVYAIPMSARPFEDTGAQRATFTVPDEHIGDGHWRHGKLKYDYTDEPEVKWLHFAARIVGTAGELLLDDVAYVEQVGPILAVKNAALDEDASRPGTRATVRARIENVGDRPARDVRAVLEAPEPLRAEPAEVDVGHLAPDANMNVSWDLVGERQQACTLTLTAQSASGEARAVITIAPELVIRSFGPKEPVGAQGVSMRFECLVKNAGNAIAAHPSVEFNFEGTARTRAETALLPGEITCFSAEYAYQQQNPEGHPVSVRVRAENIDTVLDADTRLVVGANRELPPPAERLNAFATADCAVLENEYVRLAFARNEFGFGPGRLFAKRGGRWHLVAWLPHLVRLVYNDAASKRREALVLTAEPPAAELDKRGALRFQQRTAQDGAPAWRVSVTFSLAAAEKSIAVEAEATCDRACDLLAFDGPMVYVLERDEAVFPGLEWLVDDEVSSSTLDIAEGHAHQVRYVVHPNMVTIPAVGIRSRHGVVGLLWDLHQKWDGVRDRPSVVFASPDRFNHQRAHLAGLFVPTVPDYVEPNTREAANPYPMTPGKPLRLHYHVFADGEATDPLAVLDAYFDRYGFPEPSPLPHGSYDGEIEFSMRGYLESLWNAETKEWWTSKGGHPLMCRRARPRHFVADLLLGSLVSADKAVRERCRARAEEMAAALGEEPRLDVMRFPAPAGQSMAHVGGAIALLSSMPEDGAWRFDADRATAGVFEGIDYHVLGPDNALEVGLCARNACEVLRYARITGDWDAYAKIRQTLVLIERFRVPRAAQVWEVPVHTPDVLAAADAVDAYVEAYRLCRAYDHEDADRWLRDAVTWARRGLPFIYFWDDPEQPFLVGASIPVFGASFHTWSWFGRPVQWNGLRYANAVLKLDEYDDSLPWRHIAELVIRSAIQQQDLDGENAALWPDSISAIDGQKCPWVFAPRQIIRNILKLTGRDEDPRTMIVGSGDKRIHVTTTAAFDEVSWEKEVLACRLTYPPGEQGVVLVANVVRPEAVYLDGALVSERADVEHGAEPGWRFTPAYAFLAVRVPYDGPSRLRIEGARFREVARLPEPVDRIAFGFDGSVEGWVAQHHVDVLEVRDGILCGKVTGPDPYIVRPLVHVQGDDYSVLELRMRLTAGATGQLFWTTEASPHYAEDKKLEFAVRPDGQFHEYRIEPGKHPLWAGQTITGIRIDPGNGATSADFEIDYLRGAE